MYTGDGSYKKYKLDFKTEECLLNLLEQEKEMVDRYNASIRAYDVAKRNIIRTADAKESIELASDKLAEIRTKIRLHCTNVIGLRDNLGEALYKSK